MSETTKNKKEETIQQMETKDETAENITSEAVQEETGEQAEKKAEDQNSADKEKETSEILEENNEAVENDAIGEQLQEELSVKEYQEKIAELEAKLEEQENRYLRLRADLENIRRRSQLDLQAAQKYRAQSLLTDLLPVIDNFERALAVNVESEDAKSLYKGIEMVYNALMEAVKKEGLEAIPAVGQPFDPNVHQAIMQESDPDKESGIVLKELQRGYKLKDRVLRPSMVSVNE